MYTIKNCPLSLSSLYIFFHRSRICVYFFSPTSLPLRLSPRNFRGRGQIFMLNRNFEIRYCSLARSPSPCSEKCACIRCIGTLRTDTIDATCKTLTAIQETSWEKNFSPRNFYIKSTSHIRFIIKKVLSHASMIVFFFFA